VRGEKMAYKKITGIYAIRFGKHAYIGSAVCTSGRINQHKRMLRNGSHENFVLQRMYDKHGERVVFEVIEECNREDLRMREQHHIDNTEHLLNLSKTVCELAPPEEHSKRMKGAWAKRTPEQKAAMAKKISETLKKRYREHPEELKAARENLKKGRASEKMKRNHQSTEAKEKRSSSMKKAWAKRSEEEKKVIASKISATLIARNSMI
jgi:group I intron endonuclease